MFFFNSYNFRRLFFLFCYANSLILMGESVLILFFLFSLFKSLEDVLIVCFLFSIHAVFYFLKILVRFFCYCHFYEGSISEITEKNRLRSTETRPKFNPRESRS